MSYRIAAILAAGLLTCPTQIGAVEDEELALSGLKTDAEWYAHIRLGYGMAAIPDSFTASSEAHSSSSGNIIVNRPAFEYTYPTNEDQGDAFSLGIVGGRLDPLGPVFGFELVQIHQTQGQDDFRSFGPNGLAGLGLALGRNLHLEALGVLGAGAVKQETRWGDVTGWSWNTGIRGGAYFTWRKLVLGASIEYSRMWTQASAEMANQNGGGRFDIEGSASGLGYRLEIGYKLQ